MKTKSGFITALLFTIGVMGCSQNDKDLQLKQYISYGKLIYQKQCIQCHQSNGQGLENLYPSLKNSEQIQKNPESVICLIINGKSEANPPMPSFRHLKDDELAKLVTYIGNSWENEIGLIDEEKIRLQMSVCSK